MTMIDKKAGAQALSLKPAVRALAMAGALSLPLAVWAQAVPVPFEAEGTVTNVYANPDGSVELTVFGRVMRVPPGASIHTPSATLTHAQLADPTPFPGRGAIPGFVGGTAILIGEVGADMEPVISDVAIEPAETVLIGAVTANESGAIRVMGVPLIESADARMPSEGFHNEFGFAVTPGSIPVGVLAAVEGYFGPDGNFYHFLVEAGGGDLVDPATPQSSILRARCAPGGSLEVQGSSYLPATNTVTFYNMTGFNFGSINTTTDLADPRFGSYRFRVDVNEGEVDTDGACPSQVIAVTSTNSTTATASVDGVVAPTVVVPPPNGGTAPVAVDDAEVVVVGLGTEVHLTLNDTDADGNLDVTQVQIVPNSIPAGLTVQNLGTGDVQVTAAAAGTYSFRYTVADTDGLVSNEATVTITAEEVAMGTVEITRANYRTGKDRWEARGATNQAGATVTVSLVRTSEVIATVTSDATGAWQLDARNTGITAIAGDQVRAVSSAGGSHELTVTISR